MKTIKFTIFLFLCFFNLQAKADLPFLPLKFSLEVQTNNHSEGDQIQLMIIVKNTDQTRAHSIVVAHDNLSLSRLFKVKILDFDLQSYVERYESRVAFHNYDLKFSLQSLAPNHEYKIPITLLDSISSENSLELNVPLFAGKYKLQVEYTPKGIQFWENAFHFIEDFESENNDKENEDNKTSIISPSVTNFIDLTIVRNESSKVKIGKKQFFIYFDNESKRYFYYHIPRNEIVSDTSLIHLTNLKPGQAENANEYLYNHFSSVFAEAIMRFPNGRIQEYRKFKDTCPIDLKKMEFHENGQLISFSYQDEDSYYVTKSNFQGFGNEYVYHYNLKTKKVQINTSEYDNKGKLLWSKQEFFDEDPCIMKLELPKY